jgi:hypothetical protein
MSLFSEPVGKVFYQMEEEIMLSLYLINHHAIKTHLGNGCIASHILASTLNESEWSASRPCRFSPRKSCWCPFNRRLDRQLNHSYRFKIDGNFLTLP